MNSVGCTDEALTVSENTSSSTRFSVPGFKYKLNANISGAMKSSVNSKTRWEDSEEMASNEFPFISSTEPNSTDM